MKIIPALFLAAGILMTVSCAHLEPALPSTAKPDSQSAMLYGRFSIGHNFAFKNKLALWLETVDTKHAIYIYFDENEPLYGIQVKPGHYRIVGFAGLNRSTRLRAAGPDRWHKKHSLRQPDPKFTSVILPAKSLGTAWYQRGVSKVAPTTLLSPPPNSAKNIRT